MRECEGWRLCAGGSRGPFQPGPAPPLISVGRSKLSVGTGVSAWPGAVPAAQPSHSDTQHPLPHNTPLQTDSGVRHLAEIYLPTGELLSSDAGADTCSFMGCSNHLLITSFRIFLQTFSDSFSFFHQGTRCLLKKNFLLQKNRKSMTWPIKLPRLINRKSHMLRSKCSKL